MVVEVGCDGLKSLSCLIRVQEVILAQGLSDDRIAREALFQDLNSLILRHKVASNRANAE